MRVHLGRLRRFARFPSARSLLRVTVANFAVAAVLASGCAPALSQADPLAGGYQVKGGGGARDVFLALADGFAIRHPKVIWDFEDVGSKGGAVAVNSGEADLGTSSVDLSGQLPPGVEQLPVGVIATAVAVAAGNAVTSLTRDQVRDIYSGKIRDWSAVGGAPGPISVVTRSSTSAIWASFKGYFFDRDTRLVAGATEVSETNEALRAARGSTSAIVLVTANAQSRTDPSVRLLGIDGVAPTPEHVQDGSYKVRRPLFLLFKVQPKPAIAAFLEYVRSAEGQAILSQFR